MRGEYHEQRDREPRFSVEDIRELWELFQEMTAAGNLSDLTKKEARKLIANAQPTLDNLKDIQGS